MIRVIFVTIMPMEIIISIKSIRYGLITYLFTLFGKSLYSRPRKVPV